MCTDNNELLNKGSYLDLYTMKKKPLQVHDCSCRQIDTTLFFVKSNEIEFYHLRIGYFKRI